MPKILFTAALMLISVGSLAKPDLEGVWLLGRGEGFTAPAHTAMGKELMESYDFAHDDPSLFCIPASWTRVYSNPNTPIEFVQEEEAVLINFELFDIRRRIPLIEIGDKPVHELADPDNPSLGENVGWYEGDELVVHSINYGEGIRVLTTIRGWAGLHQSDLMVTEERYSRTDEETLHIKITHFDPLMYLEPLVVTYNMDAEHEWEVAEYGCTPEEAAVNTIAN